MGNEVLKTDKSPTPLTLLQQAVEKGVDMAQLEKLMELQERWEAKQAKKSFLDALSQFQTKVPVLKKTKTAKVQTKTGGSFSYKYADLGGISQSIKNALNECGLSYRWEFKDNAGKMEVTCLVSHRDGHTETSTMEAAMDNSGAKNDIQQKGSTQTYLQRYTLIGALGLSTADEDNDGKGSPGKQKADFEQTEEEIMDQWKQTLAGVKSKIELTGIYIKNQKTVDGSAVLQAMFKKRQDELKNIPNNTKVSLP